MDTREVRQRFRHNLFLGLRVVWPVTSGVIGLIIALGVFIGWHEGWSIRDSIYFAFVTGLTIGYGDIAPKLLLSRMLAILIGMCGIILTGLVAAVAVKALTTALEDGDA